MVFSTPVFLFLFLPVSLIIYYLCPRRLRNGWLFLASLVFYAWGEPIYILIMLFSTVFDYCNGLLIGRFQRQNRPKAAKRVLIGSVAGNLLILGFFKYADFALTNLGRLVGAQLPMLGLALPIGISFYTFQTMSYTIDVYRRQAPVQRNPIDFGAYVTMFPQLVAGPIVRYQDIAEQLRGRRESVEDFAAGVQRFCLGLFKKVLLANQAGALWEQISASPWQSLPTLTAWLGILAFAFQIYFDFSGYSDMAIGLARMFGFRLLENFHFPYRCTSATDFWRRWHISLGSWFREYVYIPLGGNRRGRRRTICNLLIVWGLTGFWHGASWNFLLWGLYFGVLLIVEKQWLLQWLERVPAWLRHGYALLVVLLGWVIFALTDLGQMGHYFAALFGWNGAPFFTAETRWLFGANWLLLLVCVLGSAGVFEALRRRLCEGRFSAVVPVAACIGCGCMLLLSICFLVGAAYNPFLYFRF
jgi:alginate O-acetyltransferase complex protein AlgI